MCNCGIHYMCSECWEEIIEERRIKNMSNIKITAEVDGKQVPLENISTETFEAIKALEKSEEIPVARVGKFHGEPRLFLTLNDKLKEYIAISDVRTIAIDLKTGDFTNYWLKEKKHLPDMYGKLIAL